MERDVFKDAMVDLAAEDIGSDDDVGKMVEWVWNQRANGLLHGLENAHHEFAGLSERFKLHVSDKTVYCVRFSPDDDKVAACLDNGEIHVYGAASGKPKIVLSAKKKVAMPIMMTRGKPHVQTVGVQKSILLAVSSDGTISHWDVGGRKLLSEIEEPGNELFCIDYKSDGSQFAAAGRGLQVQVYDDAQRKKLFQVKNADTEGNTRIFSVKYHPTDQNMILTGSWDNMVKFWDVREGTRRAVRSINGPHVCADAIDISKDGKTVLTGSWHKENQLRVWNFGDCKIIDSFQWQTEEAKPKVCKVYAAQFSKHDGSSMVLAGGSGVEDAKIFDWKQNWKCLGNIACTKADCQSLDFSHAGDKIAVG